MNQFISGALAMACWTAGLFFVQFWRTSRDRFFLFFVGAFWFFAVNWIIVGVIPAHLESRHYAYLVRLVAFALLLVGIADKNRRAR